MQFQHPAGRLQGNGLAIVRLFRLRVIRAIPADRPGAMPSATALPVTVEVSTPSAAAASATTTTGSTSTTAALLFCHVSPKKGTHKRAQKFVRSIR
jgi:hypothetical protein